MPHEIERKFLVVGDGWREGADRGEELRQAYLAETDRVSVRVRIIDDASAVITVKSAQPRLARKEYEYAIPVRDALAMADLRRGSLLQKTRFRSVHAGRTWEIDVYSGENMGLVIAEVELESENEAVDLPRWVGREVTGEERYYASRLAVRPFSGWSESASGGGAGTETAAIGGPRDRHQGV